jgi:HEXXH motif-containing protein
MLDTHQVSLMSLDTMAEGRADPAIVEQLSRANRSRQLTLLRAVLDRVQKLAPAVAPSPSPAEAWTLLADAQRLDGAAVDQVITHPRTGVWATNVLRRLGQADAAVGAVPLWADLGYLHQLAAAAAIRAGHDFRTRVPVWRGAVILPTLGLADLQSRREWDFAHVHGEQGHVLIRGPAGSVQLPQNRAENAAGWLAIRTLRTDRAALWLDDLDPYREFDGPTPPHRLSDSEVTLWSGNLRDTWRLLSQLHPATAAELAVGLTTLVPRGSASRIAPYSASHADAFGSVVLSRPSDPTTFAATLVHEFQHSKLGVLLTLVDLLDPTADNTTPRLYAPWRDDPRPPIGLLHGAFSFLGVTSFYRDHSAVDTGSSTTTAQFEFAYRREQTARAVETLLAEASPSVLGRRFLRIARARLQHWTAEPLPQEVLAAAHRANLDHQLCWRLRHLRPPTNVVADLTLAWLRHRPRPVAAPAKSVLRPKPGSPPQARLELERTLLYEPELYDVYRAEPELAMAEISGTTTADLALMDSDTALATELYRQHILAVPDSPTAWAGLALSSGRAILLDRPELVFAIHQEIRLQAGIVTNPIKLAEWLS